MHIHISFPRQTHFHGRSYSWTEEAAKIGSEFWRDENIAVISPLILTFLATSFALSRTRDDDLHPIMSCTCTREDYTGEKRDETRRDEMRWDEMISGFTPILLLSLKWIHFWQRILSIACSGEMPFRGSSSLSLVPEPEIRFMQKFNKSARNEDI